MIPSRKLEVQCYSEIEKAGIERSLLRIASSCSMSLVLPPLCRPGHCHMIMLCLYISFILFQHYFNFCVFSPLVVTAYSYTYATVLLGRLLDLTKPGIQFYKFEDSRDIKLC